MKILLLVIGFIIGYFYCKHKYRKYIYYYKKQSHYQMEQQRNFKNNTYGL